MAKPKGIPQKYLDLVGTKQTIGGGVFSSNKKIEPQEYDVLDIRWGSGIVYDMERMVDLHPTFDLLLKRDGMKRAQWSRGYAIREIELEEDNG